MRKVKIDIEHLTEVPVSQLTRFLKFIAEHNLWDELEQHLKDRGCNKLLMSFEPVREIGTIVEAESHKRTIEQPGVTMMMACACNSTRPTKPKTP